VTAGRGQTVCAPLWGLASAKRRRRRPADPRLDRRMADPGDSLCRAQVALLHPLVVGDRVRRQDDPML